MTTNLPVPSDGLAYVLNVTVVGAFSVTVQLRRLIVYSTSPGLITSQPFIAHWQIIEMSNIACVNSAAQAPKD